MSSKVSGHQEPQLGPRADKNSYLVYSAIFFAISLVYIISRIDTVYDSRWVLQTAESIITEGNTDLNEYGDLIRQENFFRVDSINGRYYHRDYPIGEAVISIPFVLCAKVIYPVLFDASLDEYLKHNMGGKLQKVIASLIVAASAVVIYAIASLYLGQFLSLLTVFLYAFGTSAWSTASRAMWQHGPSMLMLSIALLLLLRAKERPALSQYVAVPLAVAYVMRPTNAISVIVLSLFIAFRYRRYLLRYVLWSMIIAVPFVAYNVSVFDSVLSPYYQAGRLGVPLGQVIEGLGGTLISPARGLFVYSPFLLFSMVGVFIATRKRTLEWLQICLMVVIGLHWVAIAQNYDWWGGDSFGPRYFSDMIPYLICLLLPFLMWISQIAGPIRTLVFVPFALTVSISAFINFRGSESRDVYVWNVDPVSVSSHTERLWDWQDLQFLRGFPKHQ
jgi:hypothetical protein